MKKEALLIFVKNMIPGHVKTRLAATIGDQAALNIYQHLLRHTHHTVKNMKAEKFVFYSNKIENDLWESEFFKKEVQQGIDLGDRMENAFKEYFKKDYEKLVLVGTDCPTLNRDVLETAFASLKDVDVAIGPATDGGYYLIGMKRMNACLFQDIQWSTDRVLQQSLNICKKNQLSWFLLPELSDIDEEKDLVHLNNLDLYK